MLEVPKINIKFGRFLNPIFDFYCQNHPDLKSAGWHEWTPPTDEYIREKVALFKKAWKERGEDVLRAITEKTGLTFKRNMIDVFIVGGNPRQFSSPIVIRSEFKPEVFFDTLVHELIHELFTENMDVLPRNCFAEMFPDEEPLTQNHILVHALLYYVYNDVLKDPKRLEENKERSRKSKYIAYARAWEIVEESGYEQCIETLVNYTKNQQQSS